MSETSEMSEMNEMNEMTKMLTLCAATGAIAGAALAVDSYRFELGATSTVDSNSTFAIETSGTMIGDHDPKSNPDGTQTRPGAFGGSGNNAIPIMLDLMIDGLIDSAPAGSVAIDFDIVTSTFVVTGYDIDLLNGGEASAPLSIALLFDTFHTVSPSALFIGGFPLELPLGELSITTMRASLGAIGGAGTLSPQLDNTWNLSGIVNLDLTVEASFGEQVLPLGTIPIAAPIDGTVVFDFPGDLAHLVLDAELADDQSIDGPFEGLQDIPFDLPTIIPPGDTASLLLSLDIDGISTTTDTSIVIDATGTRCPVDLALDGILDINDIIAFLGMFEDGDGDWNDDGEADVFDVIDFLDAFTTGC